MSYQYFSIPAAPPIRVVTQTTKNHSKPRVRLGFFQCHMLKSDLDWNGLRIVRDRLLRTGRPSNRQRRFEPIKKGARGAL